MTSKNTKYDLSIVIPYYNQPEGIYRVLHEISRQKNINIEVFVVDDASLQTCDHIVQEFVQKGLQVTLLKQKERQYTLQARLRGMRHISGRYLAFMDSDDALCSDDAYAQVLQEAECHQTDILHFVTHYTTRHGMVHVWENAYPFYKGTLKDKAIFHTWLTKDCRAHSVWNKLYSQKLYTKIIRLQHTTYIQRIEDFYLNAFFLFFAEKYVSSTVPVYYYSPPQKGHIEKFAARGLDAMRMYCAFPQIFKKFGIDEHSLHTLQSYLRKLTTLNIGKMCKELPCSFDITTIHAMLESKEMVSILKYGTKKEFALAFLIANASNAQKLVDIYRQ